MEGFKKFVKNILYPACFIFTVIIFMFSVLNALMDFNMPYVLTPKTLLPFILFSLILSWSNEIFRSRKMSFPAAHFIHYIIYLLNVLISFVILEQRQNVFGNLIVFSILYLIGALVALIVRKVSSKKTEEKKTPYKKQFK
ncbi:MAG: hypothetical protein IJ404_02505 [Clostridia bacterium]|nr:hypothetical protein [Clostridia bacterium]